MSKEIKKTGKEVKNEQDVKEIKAEEKAENMIAEDTTTEETSENTETTGNGREEADVKDTKADDVKDTKVDNVKDTKADDKTLEPKKDKTKPLIGVIILLGLILVGLCVYVVSNAKKTSPTVVETGQDVNKSVLTDALNNLKKKDSFIVSTYVSAPMGNTSYIEYVTPDSSATLVDDNNIETPFQQIDLTTTQYRYNDLIKDGHMYFFYESADESGNPITEVYQAPDDYAKDCGVRSYMFFDLMKDDIQDLEYAETVQSTDLGNGPVDMAVYKGKLSSDIVKRILGNGTIALYESVRKNTDNAGLKKMMGWLIDDIDFTMQYSDANVLIGVVDDTLTYVNLEIGGLGTKMYVTKCFIENTDVAKEVTIPSIEGAVTYETLYSDYADMAEHYDSMDELYDAIYNQNNKVSEEQLQEMLDNAVQDTEEKTGRDIETEVITDDATTEQEPTDTTSSANAE